MSARSERMIFPNFLIIGAAKSGTTSLYHYLKQHPEIYLSPVKEPKFFCFYQEKLDWQGPGDQKAILNYVTDIDQYFSLFEGVRNETAIGEATPWYIYSESAVKKIKAFIPDAKLIAILRDPAERAYSHFLHLLREGREPLADFQDALDAEEERTRRNWGWTWQYKSRGLYYSQLKKYFDTFPNKIYVYIYMTNSKKILSLLLRISLNSCQLMIILFLIFRKKRIQHLFQKIEG